MKTAGRVSTSAPSPSDDAAKQPLSHRFHKLQRVTPDPGVTAPVPEIKTCYVILSNLGASINDLKIKELCNQVGPIFVSR